MYTINTKDVAWSLEKCNDDINLFTPHTVTVWVLPNNPATSHGYHV